MTRFLVALLSLGGCPAPTETSSPDLGIDSGMDSGGEDSAPVDTACDTGELRTWATDADGDGFGDPATAVHQCEPPEGAVADATDCDDADATVFPGAAEDCDGVDDDCDGTADNGVATWPWYADLDGDGYGDEADSVLACAPPAGRVADGTDCDDTRTAVNPGASEVCDNGLDDDCDGAAVGCGIAGTVDLSTADATLVGATAHDAAGSVVAGPGDVNGDGLDDLLLGVPDAADTTTGAAYLVFGAVSGFRSLGRADATFHGEGDRDRAGSSVAGAGDTNGDGFADVLVGADNAADLDSAFLFFGPVTGDLDLSDADVTWAGETDRDRVGYALAGAGDVNGDGNADVLLGAFGHEGTGLASGAAYLLLGPFSGSPDLTLADATLLGEAPADFAGSAVAGAGDVDGDGLDDLLVGALHADDAVADVGVAYLVLGPPSGDVDLASAEARLVGEAEGDFAGVAVSGAGDVNGDGFADLLVGAYGNDEGGEFAGAAYLVLGPVSGNRGLATADAKLVGEAPGDLAGASVAAAGDVDGDGTDDVLVGAYGQSAGGSFAGAAYLVRGPVAGTVDLSTAAATLVGEDGEDRAGTSVAGLGDADGDGWADVLVGAPEAGTTEEGLAYVLYGGGF